MKTILFVLAFLALPNLSFADPGNGIDMQWQDCVGGPEAVRDRTFNCAGNSTHVLILNFKISETTFGFIAFTAYLDLLNETPGPLAPFWHYETGGCQRMGGSSPNGVSISDALPSTTHCVDNFTDVVGGDPSAGLVDFAAYSPDNDAPGRAKLIVLLACEFAIPIIAGDNKFAMHLDFNTRNRTGDPDGSYCEGCGQRVSLVWNYATLESNNGDPPYRITGPDKGQACVTIQGGSPAVCAVTPALDRTWGSLKALYR